MSLKEMKDLALLKDEVERKRNEVSDLYQKNVVPLLEKYEEDFINELEAYFKRNEFEVQISGLGIEAQFGNSLTFSCMIENGLVRILKDGENFAYVRIEHRDLRGNTRHYSAANEYEREKTELTHKIEDQERLIRLYEEPVVYYEAPNGAMFQDAKEVVEKIFA